MALRPRIPPRMFSTYLTRYGEYRRDILFETDLDFPNYILTVLGFLFGIDIKLGLLYLDA
jgi:hypothetical protein